MISREQQFTDPDGLYGGEGAEVYDLRQPPIFEREVVLAAVNRLSPALRIILTARDIEGLNYDQIAERHGLTRDEVKQVIYEAREEVLKQLYSNRQ